MCIILYMMLLTAMIAVAAVWTIVMVHVLDMVIVIIHMYTDEHDDHLILIEAFI